MTFVQVNCWDFPDIPSNESEIKLLYSNLFMFKIIIFCHGSNICIIHFIYIHSSLIRRPAWPSWRSDNKASGKILEFLEERAIFPRVTRCSRALDYPTPC